MRTGRPVLKVSYNGKDTTVSELAALAGCSRQTMFKRLSRGKTPEQAVAEGALHPRNVPVLHPYKDQFLNVHQLAALAGVSRKLMQQRLQARGAEAAVALGKATYSRPKPKPAPKPRGATYMHKGQALTVRQLSDLAGCSKDAMRLRLSSGISADDAVAMGKADKNRSRASGPKPKKEPKQRVLRGAWASKPARLYDRLDAAEPVVCNVAPVVVPHKEDHRHTFTGTPGRWVDSSQCRPWAASIGG